MKVSKSQVKENRAHIVKTASVLFRERGYDGVSVADIMEAAGFTHGGFYKHFESKAALMAEAATCGFSQSAAKLENFDSLAVVEQYLSRRHRDAVGDGCTLAALGGDAVRQSDSVKRAFAEGIECQLASFKPNALESGGGSSHSKRAEAISILAEAVGAVVLSRACPDDSPLADEILDACRERILSQRGSRRP